MKKVILTLLISGVLLADEYEFNPDPTVVGLEYCIKPNGAMVFRQCGARVPEKKNQEVAQLLNPEFLCEISGPEKIQDKEIAQENPPKNLDECPPANEKIKQSEKELKL